MAASPTARLPVTPSRTYKFSCHCHTFDITPRKLTTALAGLRVCGDCKRKLEFAGQYREKDGPWKLVSTQDLMSQLQGGKAKRIVEATRRPPTPPRTAPPAPMPVAAHPTDKQLALAKKLAKSTRTEIPQKCLTSKSSMSTWIRSIIAKDVN